jgi:hypothetical protein
MCPKVFAVCKDLSAREALESVTHTCMLIPDMMHQRLGGIASLMAHRTSDILSAGWSVDCTRRYNCKARCLKLRTRCPERERLMRADEWAVGVGRDWRNIPELVGTVFDERR